MYMTVSELNVPEDVLIRLTDDEAAGAVNEPRAEAAIAAAQALVDASLSRVYGVPLEGPPELVKKLTRDIAVYYLYLRVGSLTDEAKTAYEDAGQVLERLARKEMLLDADTSRAVPDPSGQDREFTREYMRGF